MHRTTFGAIAVVLALSVSVTTVLANPGSAGMTSPGGDALPSIIHVGVPARAPSLTAAATAGYGYIEPIGEQRGPNHRLAGAIAGSFSPAEWLAVSLSFEGRYDHHPPDDMGSDYTMVGDPRLTLRARRLLLSQVHVGLEGTLWLPGRAAPSVSLEAASPEARALAGWMSSTTTIAGHGGFRLDRSARTLDDADNPRFGDLLSSGISDYDVVLFGLGMAHRVGGVIALAEVTQELLVGSGAPSVAESPLTFGIGARWQAASMLWFEGTMTASPSRRPADPRSERVPIMARFAGSLGIRVALEQQSPAPAVIPRKRMPAKEPITTIPPEPMPVPVAEAEPTVGLSGRVTDEGGNEIPDALVKLHVTSGEPLQTYTDSAGNYTFEALGAGTYTVGASTPGFEPTTRQVTVGSSAQAPVDLMLYEALPAGQVRGLVQSFEGKPLRATLTITPGGTAVETAADGTFSLDVPPGRHTVEISAAGYKTQRRRINVEDRGVTVINADLRRAR